MTSCLDKQALRDNGLEYINKKCNLAVTMNTVLDGICDVMSTHICLNFDLINDKIWPIYNSNEEQEAEGGIS